MSETKEPEVPEQEEVKIDDKSDDAKGKKYDGGAIPKVEGKNE